MKAIKKETSSQKRHKKSDAKAKQRTSSLQPAGIRSRGGKASKITTEGQKSSKTREVKSERKKAVLKKKDQKPNAKKGSDKKHTTSQKAQTGVEKRHLPSPIKRLSTRRSMAELPDSRKIDLLREKKSKAIHQKHPSKDATKASPSLRKIISSRTTKVDTRAAKNASPKRHQRIIKKAKNSKISEIISGTGENKTGPQSTGLPHVIVREEQILALKRALQNDANKIDLLTKEIRTFQADNQSLKQEITQLVGKFKSITPLTTKKAPDTTNIFSELQSSIQKLQRNWEKETADLKQIVSTPSRAPSFDSSKIQTTLKSVVEKVELILHEQKEILQNLRSKKIQKEPSPAKQEAKQSPISKKRGRQVKQPRQSVEAQPSGLTEKAPPNPAADKAPKTKKVDAPPQNEKGKIAAVEALLNAQSAKPEAPERLSNTNRIKTPQKDLSNDVRDSTHAKDSNKNNIDSEKVKDDVHHEEKQRRVNLKPMEAQPAANKTEIKSSEAPASVLPHSLPTKVTAPLPAEPPQNLQKHPAHPAIHSKVEAASREVHAPALDFVLNFNADRYKPTEHTPERPETHQKPEQKPAEKVHETLKTPIASGPLAMGPKPLADSNSKSHHVGPPIPPVENKNPENLPIKTFFDKSEESANKIPALADMTRHTATKPEDKRNFFS